MLMALFSCICICLCPSFEWYVKVKVSWLTFSLCHCCKMQKKVYIYQKGFFLITHMTPLFFAIVCLCMIRCKGQKWSVPWISPKLWPNEFLKMSRSIWNKEENYLVVYPLHTLTVPSRIIKLDCCILIWSRSQYFFSISQGWSHGIFRMVLVELQHVPDRAEDHRGMPRFIPEVRRFVSDRVGCAMVAI